MLLGFGGQYLPAGRQASLKTKHNYPVVFIFLWFGKTKEYRGWFFNRKGHKVFRKERKGGVAGYDSSVLFTANTDQCKKATR